jgi:hypothetical protein
LRLACARLCDLWVSRWNFCSKSPVVLLLTVLLR